MKNAKRVALTTPVGGATRLLIHWPATHIIAALVADPDPTRKRVLTIAAMTGLPPDIASEITEKDADAIFEAARELE